MRKWILAVFFSVFALGLTVTTVSTEARAAETETTTEKKGLVKENGKYYYYKNGEKITSTLKKVTKDGKTKYYYFGKSGAAVTSTFKKITKDGKAKYYYFGSKGAAYTNKWKTITSSSGKKYRYYFGKDGAAYASGVTKNNNPKEPIVKTIDGKKYAFDYKGRALTGVQVINDKFYYFNSNGKKNDTKTSKLRKASKYEKNVTTLQKLLKSYGCKPTKTKYYDSSCYGDGRDGYILYKNFKLSVFKYRKSGKVIIFEPEWRRNS